MLGPRLEVEMSRKWTPLCREAHFEVKTYKAYQRQRPILLEVEMLKKCTPLWRKTHFEVKMCRNLQRRTTFGSWDVEKVYAVVARSTFPSQNVKDTTCSDHFWRFRCGFAWQAQGILHLAKSEQNVRVLWHFQKRWQAWDICRGSAKMYFAWWAQCKRHVHQRC